MNQEVIRNLCSSLPNVTQNRWRNYCCNDYPRYHFIFWFLAISPEPEPELTGAAVHSDPALH